jgi:hypothetical protein
MLAYMERLAQSAALADAVLNSELGHLMVRIFRRLVKRNLNLNLNPTLEVRIFRETTPIPMRLTLT